MSREQRAGGTARRRREPEHRRVRGLCLEPADLAVSKFVAGREKDVAFLRVLLRERMVSIDELRRRIGKLPLPWSREAPRMLATVETIVR